MLPSKKLGLDTALSMIRPFRQISLLFNDGWVCLEYRVAYCALQSRTYVWLSTDPFPTKTRVSLHEKTARVCIAQCWSCDVYIVPLTVISNHYGVYFRVYPQDFLCNVINHVRQRVASHHRSKQRVWRKERACSARMGVIKKRSKTVDS